MRALTLRDHIDAKWHKMVQFTYGSVWILVVNHNLNKTSDIDCVQIRMTCVKQKQACGPQFGNGGALGLG